MSNQINETNAAPCGAAAVVMAAKIEGVATKEDGVVVVNGITRGDNENNISVEVRATETAAEQILAEVAKAKTKELPGIKIWVHGPCELEFETSAAGDQRVLKLCVGADLVRPAHPLMKVEPLQNSFVLFGSASITEGGREGKTFYAGSLEFPHLATERVAGNSSPAAAKLTGGSAEALFESNGKDLMVSGRFSRQTGEMNGKPYDHISLAVSTAVEIRIPGGTPRRAPKATASNTVVTADYESGWGDEGSVSDAAKAEFAALDF